MLPDLRHNVEVGIAVPTQSVQNATVNGSTIEDPWFKGRELAFLIVGGTFGAAVAGQARVQVQKRSDSSWVNLTDASAATVQFPTSLFADGAGGENKALFGSIDLSRIDSDTYKAMRLVFQETGNAAMVIGAAYMIFDQRATPAGQTDHLAAFVI